MYERRFASKIGVRAESKGGEMWIKGYAATFGALSSDLGGFREKILPGAFRSCISAGQDTKCLRDHDPSQILGRVKNRTLTLAEDARGLRFRCLLPNTTCAKDTYELVRSGNLDGCSFAFSGVEDEWDDCEDPDDPSARCNVRTIRSVRNLWDCSVCTQPAYPQTSVTTDDDDDGVRSTFELFPLGVPVEVRSRIQAFKNVSPQGRAARQRLLQFFIS